MNNHCAFSLVLSNRKIIQLVGLTITGEKGKDQ